MYVTKYVEKCNIFDCQCFKSEDLWLLLDINFKHQPWFDGMNMGWDLHMQNADLILGE